MWYLVQTDQFSFSQPIGSGGGESFVLTGEGPITSIRLWERYNSYVTGIQLRYGATWSQVVGYQQGTVSELELFKDEAVIQISGKCTSYVQSVVFMTNKSRTLQVGQPRGKCFNMYAANKEATLRIISGRFQNGFRSFAAHWNV
ncbi:zymogen granule membrane protein 16-like [Corythoichthys intestinalis]|uniref:zymogen granule membrane protein 16-like n=1 Tax=Corythoichthys intestinalis TaxID=161448 RepID=UPI0025A5F94C|nr:zymogen granule membrane protein 16-like [Corythoichthys intestinalis]